MRPQGGLRSSYGDPALAQAKPDKFDGTYVGAQTRTGGKGCGLGREVTMPVKDGTFTWGVPPAARKIPIAADDTIDGRLGTLILKGNATATGLDFTTYMPACNNLSHFYKK